MKTPQQLLERLNDLGITHEYYQHPPVFSVAQAQRHCSHIPGGHCKNLFLRSKKKAYWLVVLKDDAWVDLKQLGKNLGAGALSFASRERLHEILGVIPGAVTPLALINDVENRSQIAIDQRLMAYQQINFHPLVNHATLSLAPQDLLKFIRACQREPVVTAL